MNKKIGVFDSGLGGITVLNYLKDFYPNYDFIYLADSLNCPYGEKTSKEIENLVTKNTLFLESLGVELVVIACNTASANSGAVERFTQIPIVRIIKPTALEALKKTKTNNILVLATNLTIENKAYDKYLEGVNIYSVKGSRLVPIVEEGLIDTKEADRVVLELLDGYQNKGIDTLILGCTHFPLLKMSIKKVMPDVVLVDSFEPVRGELEALIGKGEEGKMQKITLYTTGKAENFKKQLGIFHLENAAIKEARI